MPSLNLAYGQSGPLCQVQISISAPHLDALLKTGRRPPPAVDGTFLIDTGASGTCVDPDLIAPLGLTPTGSIPIRTPSTGTGVHHCDQFDIMLHILGPNAAQLGHLVPALPVVTTPLRSQGIDGLIGRDVLDACVLIVNGPACLMTLSF